MKRMIVTDDEHLPAHPSHLDGTIYGNVPLRMGETVARDGP